MAIKADVVNGQLQYNYTDKASENKNLGSNLGYDQFLQLLCAEMQYQDPLEPTSNTDYVAQLATFSQLEATLSLGDTQSSQFANTLVGKQVILKTTNANGNETYIDGKVDYVLYQDGKVKLAVNDGLYDLDTLDTIADSNYYEAIAMSKSFLSMLNSLPDIGNITTTYGTAIQQIRDFYDGMTDYQKGFIDDDSMKVLRTYEERIEELKKIEENQKENEENQDTNDDTETDVVEEVGE